MGVIAVFLYAQTNPYVIPTGFTSLLMDASTQMNLNKHFVIVIEFKGEYAAWDRDTEPCFALALYPFSLPLINAV